MRALILETSTQKNFALLAEEKKVQTALLLPEGPELSKKLGQEIKKILGEERVDLILVGQGPGSYTGIRVGAALAKGLSFGWNIPLYGFCSLKAFVPPQSGSFAILLDARMGGIYILQGERKKTEISYCEPVLLKPEELAPLLTSIPHVVSPSPHLLVSRLPQVQIQEAAISFEELAELAFRDSFQTPLQFMY